MYTFDSGSLSSCHIAMFSTGSRKKANLDTFSRSIEYFNKQFKLRLLATDLRMICKHGLAILTFSVSSQVEAFFEDLEIALNASEKTITDGKICVSTTDLSKIPLNMHENKPGHWCLEIQVNSIYESGVGDIIVNSLEKLYAVSK